MVVEVSPVAVASGQPLRWWYRSSRVAVEPTVDVVVVELLAPQEPGTRLTQHERLVGDGVRGKVGVELVRLAVSALHDRVERSSHRAGLVTFAQPHPDLCLGARRDRDDIV